MQAGNRGTVEIASGFWSSAGTIKAIEGGTALLNSAFRLGGNRFDGHDGKLVMGDTAVFYNRQSILTSDRRRRSDRLGEEWFDLGTSGGCDDGR